MDRKKIAVIGGAGYIGSHVSICLLKAGYDVHIVDNFSNSSPDIIKKIIDISGFYVEYSNIDIYTNSFTLNTLFAKNKFHAVIHLAGLKSPSESIRDPLLYYGNNVIGSVNLLNVMVNNGCKRLIFSSSATVYGNPEEMPVTEKCPTSPTNPYGKTKLMTEQIISDLPDFSSTSLRYFNPVGSLHPDLSEDLKLQIPGNLFPYITKVIRKEISHLNVFGNDWDSPDGSGVRDFIHIIDLAEAHVAALDSLKEGHFIYNVGTGVGYSVLEIIKTFESLGANISYKISTRRLGDIGVCYSDPTLANKELKWKSTRNIQDMCRDSLPVL